MRPVEQLEALLARPEPLLALAPMQDVTDLPFWGMMSRYGGADVYYTEYFRVHSTSHLEKPILRSITENPTGRPVIAQMIGNDIPSLVRSARELQNYQVAGIDLNLGCPAPVVYRKCAGGGLLRDPKLVDSILGAMRDCIEVKFTVKTRIGFDSPALFSQLLELFRKHSPDLLTVHARTVTEMYRPAIHLEYIREAVEAMSCPVIANGNVDCVASSEATLEKTKARGLMIGRGAIRNPCLFEQIRRAYRGEPFFVPRGRDVLRYVYDLYDSVKPPVLKEGPMVQKMKKYMNYLAVGVDPNGQFLHDIRRVTTEKDFFAACERFLDHDEPMFTASVFDREHPRPAAAAPVEPVAG